MNALTLRRSRTGFLMGALCALLAVLPAPAPAEDIDIFVTNNATASTFDNPNVLIIVDNSSNWSRADQKWPGGVKQGQSELQAIKTVVGQLDDTINVGLMLFTDTGVGREGGYIRFPVMQMTAANKTAFQNLAQYIYDNFQSPSEKTSASANYSAVMFDAFKYFGGYTSPNNVASGTAGTPADATHFGPMVFNQRTDATLANVGGYTDATLSTYSGPIASANSCARNFVIFIGNGFPDSDIGSPQFMDTYLSGINGSTTQLAVPGFTTTNVTSTTDLGYTSACYTSQAACQTTDFASQCGTGLTYPTCSCSGTSTTTLDACPSGQSRYQVLGTTTSSSSSTTTTTTTNTGATAACYTSAPTATTAANQFGMTCPSTSVAQVGNVITTTHYACSYAIGATTTSGSSCTASSTTGPTAGTPVASTATTNSCYASNSTGDTNATNAVSGGTDRGGLACPSTSTVTSGNITTTTTYSCSFAESGRTSSGAACSSTTLSGPTAGTAVDTLAFTTSCYSNANTATDGIAAGDHGGLTCPASTSTTDGNGVSTTTSYSCAYARDTGSGATEHGSCATGSDQYRVAQTATPSVTTAQTQTRHTVTMTATPSVTTVTTASGGSHYVVTQTVVATATAVTTGSSTTVLGNTTACYSSPPTGTPTDFSCAGYSSCSFGGATTAAACPSGARFLVQGNSTTSQVVSNNTYSVPTSNKQRMTDEWARYMYQTDANSVAGQQNISTYTIDVFNAKQDADQTALLMSMARVGGGKYFAAKNENAIVSAMKPIMSEIQAVNTVFASASLPVNATNRAQNENQVFIGMFRPDPAAQPRWYGNVKRYQLANFSGVIDLADINGNLAVNLQTGFVSECATSWWTSDSGSYWQSVPNNPPAEGRCTTSSFNQWSDSPDGPLVEKGAAAEVIRKGNNPPATDTSPTWAPNRTIKTVSGGALVDFTAASSGLAQTLVDFISGKDVNDENANGLTTAETRPSLHGDVIHSRPLPVNYSTTANPTAGVTVFYGSNDGTLRAIDATNGKERWALVAPEFYSRFSRLYDNSPIIKFPNQATGITPSPTPKAYFWDGSMGIFQNADNTSIRLFPAMRRGGRMIYGLDVTTVGSPSLLWTLGCPNLTDDTGCSAPDGADVSKVDGTDGSAIGQTWSTPAVAFIRDYPTRDAEEPVLVVGGGYDSCEDDNSSAPSCASQKGAAIYVIKASDGSVIKKFPTTRSVASDVSMVDVDNDGFVDYAYVADTGGNVYRVDFVDGAASFSKLASANWAIYRVAYTNGAGSPVISGVTAPRKFFFPPALLYSNNRIYVALGSGDREHPLEGDYPFAAVLNRFYVYLDTLATKPTTVQSVNLDDTSLFFDNTSAPTCDSDQVLASSAKKGWFMNLNQNGTQNANGLTGEQTVTSAVILGGLVTFSTNRPIPPATGSCTTTLGEARGYWVNLLNGSGGIGVGTAGICGGTRSATFVGGGLPPSPVTGIVPVEGVSRTVIIGAVQRDGTASAPIGGQKVIPSIKATRKRVYWFKNVDN